MSNTPTIPTRPIPSHLGLECEGGGTHTDYDGTLVDHECAAPATFEMLLDCGWGETRWVALCGKHTAEEQAAPSTTTDPTPQEPAMNNPTDPRTSTPDQQAEALALLDRIAAVYGDGWPDVLSWLALEVDLVEEAVRP